MIKFKLMGVLLLFYFIFLFVIIGFEIGALMVLALGLVLINYYHIYKIKILHYLFIVGISCFLFVVIGIFIYSHNNNVTYNEDAIIILGCGLAKDEETVSLSLENRLISAIEYSKKNQEAIIVVSGGQGTNEKISEALAMERYLVDKGIPISRIIKEDKSTSTYENFEFSKIILDEYFEEEYNIAFVTNDYHIFRANNTAKKIGFSATHYYGDTPIYVAMPSYFREVLAIFKYLVLM